MRTLLLLFALLFQFTLSAQNYSRVKVYLDENHTIRQLAALGLETDHGMYAPLKHFINDFSRKEINQIEAAGFKTKILIEDLEAYYVEQNNLATPIPDLRTAGCDPNEPKYDYPTPVNYTYGSMGGYFTYQEMLDMLDDMANQYPDLISMRAPIGNITTHEGRPVYWLRVSDNPLVDEDEPEVLYTALHHAREPNSLSQMIFFLWHLLENYDTDPEIKYLLDNTELYFIPCVNPDGYVYNETTNPDGGGFWRKNRRANNDGTFGVDLNRNYGFHWGYDNVGSSPVTDSQTYRGPGPFSEPETQAVRAFCEAHQFQIALNYHTYGNLLIHPWGYSDTLTDDHDTFTALASAMNRENDFLTGTGTQTVGYIVNGDSDDWMYGEQTTKNPIFSMTPEVGPGSFGFWPPQSAIDEFNKSCLLMNLTAAHLVHNFGLVTDKSPEIITTLQGEIEFSLKKHGLKTGLLSVSLEPVSDNISWVGPPQNFGLVQHETVESGLPFLLSPDIESGETVAFNIVVDNGLYAHKTLIQKIYSDGTSGGQIEIFSDAADDLGNWTTDNWGITNARFFSAPSSLTDSPNGQYGPNTNNAIILENPIQLTNAATAKLTFWASWDIENDYDFVQCLISVNGGPFNPMCGKYTNLGTSDQYPDQPLYDGTQSDWVKEEIDLSEYVDLSTNPEIRISFLMISDGAVEGDGFYFDDMSIEITEEGTTSTQKIDLESFAIRAQPNPASDFTTLQFSKPISPTDNANVLIFNTLGQKIYAAKVTGTEHRVELSDWMPGLYFYQLQKGTETMETGRLSVAH